MGFMDQFRRPTGRQGRIVAAAMNKDHEALTTWGLTHITIASDYLILDGAAEGAKPSTD